MIEDPLPKRQRRLEYSDLAGADSHAVLADLRRAAPVAWIDSAQGWLVTRHDLAAAVMRSAELFTVADPRFSTARVIGPSMVSLDGPEHLRQREPFSEQLRPRNVERWAASMIAETADSLIARIAGRGCAEVRGEFAGPLVATVVVALLGLAELPPATLIEWCTAIDRAVEGLTVGGLPSARSTVALQALRASLRRAIDQPGNESVPQAVLDSGDLDREDVLANAVFLALASINPEAAILNALVHFLQDPRQLELAREDSGLLRGAVAESQRLEPATAFVDRYATHDVTLGGCRIRRGQLVRVSISAANRDPSVFADPDRFDAGRSNLSGQLTFATGPHMCIGVHLARMEATVALDRLLSLSGLRLDPDYEERPEGLIFRKPAALHVRWNA